MATQATNLRREPYDPDTVDADNDGIVQEGTAWERPFGTRLFDDLGREIVRGAISGARPANIRVTGRDGSAIEFSPSYSISGRPETAVAPPQKPGQSTLAALGYRSFKEMGLPTVGQIAGKENSGKRLNEITSDIAKIVNPPQASDGTTKK